MTAVTAAWKPGMSDAEIDSFITSEKARCAAIEPGPCPDWCTLGEGHPFSSDEPLLQLAVRYHESAFGHGVTIEQRERINVDGTVTLDDGYDSISILLDLDPDGVTRLGSGDALNLAQELRRAALELDHITHHA